MGFITKWWNDYSYALSTQKGKLCSSGEGVTNAGDAIDITRAQGAFWILLSGVILAAAGFALEYLIRMTRKAIRAVEAKRHKGAETNGAAHPHGIDSRYHKQYDIYNHSAVQESSRSYQPSGGIYGMVLPDTGSDGKMHELKLRHTLSSNTSTVVRF